MENLKLLSFLIKIHSWFGEKASHRIKNINLQVAVNSSEAAQATTHPNAKVLTFLDNKIT